MTMVVVYYTTSHSYGEGWGVDSYIELVGFLGLVMGTLLFNGVFNDLINRLARQLNAESFMVVDEGSGNRSSSDTNQSKGGFDDQNESSLKQPQQNETEMETFAENSDTIPTLTVVHDLSADDFDEYSD